MIQWLTQGLRFDPLCFFSGISMFHRQEIIIFAFNFSSGHALVFMWVFLEYSNGFTEHFKGMQVNCIFNIAQTVQINIHKVFLCWDHLSKVSPSLPYAPSSFKLNTTHKPTNALTATSASTKYIMFWPVSH